MKVEQNVGTNVSIILVFTLFSLIFLFKKLNSWFIMYCLNGDCSSPIQVLVHTCSFMSPEHRMLLPLQTLTTLAFWQFVCICLTLTSRISYALPVLIVCKGLSSFSNKPRQAPYLLCLLWMLRSMCNCISNNLAPKQMSIYFSQLPLIITILNLVVYKMDGLLIQFTKIVH